MMVQPTFKFRFLCYLAPLLGCTAITDFDRQGLDGSVAEVGVDADAGVDAADERIVDERIPEDAVDMAMEMDIDTDVPCVERCTGCCEGERCVTASASACGAAGASCSTCDALLADRCSAEGSCACGEGAPCAAGQRCSEGVCVCDATSCADGCCDGDACLSSDIDMCGAGGEACFACDPFLADRCTEGGCACGTGAACDPALTDRCSGGACMCGEGAAPCDPIAADNCDGGTCRCGTGATCGENFACRGGACGCENRTRIEPVTIAGTLYEGEPIQVGPGSTVSVSGTYFVNDQCAGCVLQQVIGLGDEGYGYQAAGCANVPSRFGEACREVTGSISGTLTAPRRPGIYTLRTQTAGFLAMGGQSACEQAEIWYDAAFNLQPPNYSAIAVAQIEVLSPPFGDCQGLQYAVGDVSLNGAGPEVSVDPSTPVSIEADWTVFTEDTNNRLQLLLGVFGPSGFVELFPGCAYDGVRRARCDTVTGTATHTFTPTVPGQYEVRHVMTADFTCSNARGVAPSRMQRHDTVAIINVFEGAE
ncbi:MAG: hypothetical protein AAF411_11080 [Myxococcota bacterium]